MSAPHSLLVEVQPLPTLRLFMQPNTVTLLESWPNGVPKGVSEMSMERFLTEVRALRHSQDGAA
jgi:hypothetical protein